MKEDKFKLIYAQFFPRGAETNSYARFVFNSFDVQRKQEITFTDFVIGLSVLTRGTIDEQLRWIFTLYDLNRDGCVTRDELSKIVNSIHDLMGKFALNSSQAAALSAQINNQDPPNSATSISQSQSPCNLNAKSGKQSATTTTTTTTSSNQNFNNLANYNANFNNNNNSNNNKQNTTIQQQQQQYLLMQQQLSNEQQTENLFKKFDLNNDGVITLDEFLEACYKVSTVKSDQFNHNRFKLPLPIFHI